MDTNIKISDFRISFVWVETILDVLLGTAPKSAPQHVMGTEKGYTVAFKEALANKALGGLHVPWEPASLFWKYYLEFGPKGRLADVNTHQAWRKFIPLREQLSPNPINARIAGVTRPVLAEALFYPHGTALSMTVFAPGKTGKTLSLQETFDVVNQVRKDRVFTVKWADGNPQQMTLDEIADKCLVDLRGRYGPKAAGARPPWEPFSIFTVVRGEGVDPEVVTPSGKDVHLVLEAISKGFDQVGSSTTENLDEVKLDIRSRESKPSNVLYAHQRGRAIWFPGRLTSTDKTAHALACYHKNLVYASTQVESLSGLLVETSKMLDRGEAPSSGYADYIRLAMNALRLLYIGNKKDPARGIYRSWSLRQQLKENGTVDVINALQTTLTPEKKALA